MADVSDSAQVECHSQSLPIDHCRKLQIDVEEYAHTLKGISEVEGQIRHAQLFTFLYGAQDMEKLQQELQRWKIEKENIEGLGFPFPLRIFVGRGKGILLEVWESASLLER
ncbi:hypothetical protein NPIL_223581, partial [Nephila pilipes]